MNNKSILLSLFIVLLFACTDQGLQEGIVPNLPSNTLKFSSIESSHSGIKFNNKLTPDVATKANLFDFDFFYNGAGVGIADINQDGLKDIFFCGNQVENKLYLNQGNLQFKDISASAGINTGKAWANGVTFADVNEDGWLDIYVTQAGPNAKNDRKNLLFINQKDNTFQEAAEKYGLADTGLSTQAAFFDFDKDGDLDCIVANENELYGIDPIRFFRLVEERPELKWESSSHLYRNDGGTYTDITEAANLLRPTFGLGLTVSDINEDGWLDIYIANDYYIPDNLYINQRNGSFRDEAKMRMKQMSFFGMGVDIADVNNDGEKDIYVLDMASADHYRAKTLMASMSVAGFDLLVNQLEMPHQYMFNSLQVNQGEGNYNNVAHFSKVAKTDWSWAGLLADFNNDGWKDIFVSNGYRKYALDNDLRNEINAAKQAHQGNVPQAVKQALYDKMPSEPLPNLLYLNQSELNFKDKTTESGLDAPSFSNGAAYADLDNDGDLDLVTNNIDAEAFLYKNLSREQNAGNFLHVELDGNLSESFAKVTLKYEGQQQVVEAKRVRGYFSATDDIAHFGIGKQSLIDTVRVEWLSGEVEERYKIKANQVLRFKESDASKNTQLATNTTALFTQVSIGKLKLSYKHKENEYNDFEKEVLLPYKQSTLGPCLAKGDVNGDGLEDVFIGGAAGQGARLFIQTDKGFTRAEDYVFEVDKDYEDLNALFFDADSDGDQDLFVSSGGNAFAKDSKRYENRLYINNGTQFLRSPQQFSAYSSKAAAAIDYDGDGDLDLLEGNRMLPQAYPTPAPSYLYRNDGGQFTDVTQDIAPMLLDGTGINAIEVTDFDEDGDQDLLTVGEWGSIELLENESGTFKKSDKATTFQDLKGWFFSIHSTDINKDGRPDYIIGNVGLNTKFKASPTQPFKVYANDFDGNGTLDVVLSCDYKGEAVPVRGRECSSQQMPFIQEKFPTYDAFAKASLSDIYGEKLEEAIDLYANEFRSLLLINEGASGFRVEYLPAAAQQFPILDVIMTDLNKDGYEDAILVGNIYNTEVETPRWDAGSGLVLYANQVDNYVSTPDSKSLSIAGNTKSLLQITHKGLGKRFLIAGRNNDLVAVYELRD